MAATTEDYEDLKRMADNDHQAMHFKSKSDATADLRTIFSQDKEYKNPTTGKIQNGYWCKICLQDKSIPRNVCFFTGSTSSLRMHIARNSSHVEIYLERCSAVGVEPNARALSRTQSGSSDRLEQTTLDSAIIREQKLPPFTTAGLLDYIIELIVFEDETVEAFVVSFDIAIQE
ncbi:hypothetical protein H0H92_014074 [Tricholoma furcatifolium]|nr:hypothetical protein H0H92_014074 [Tricholoma furcatifolium]